MKASESGRFDRTSALESKPWLDLVVHVSKHKHTRTGSSGLREVFMLGILNHSLLSCSELDLAPSGAFSVVRPSRLCFHSLQLRWQRRFGVLALEVLFEGLWVRHLRLADAAGEH